MTPARVSGQHWPGPSSRVVTFDTSPLLDTIPCQPIMSTNTRASSTIAAAHPSDFPAACGPTGPCGRYSRSPRSRRLSQMAKARCWNRVWAILNQGQFGDCWDYSALNALMTKINMLYQEQILLDASVAIVLTGQYDGGSIDSAVSQVQSVTGVPTAAFMGTDPTRAITKRSMASWPNGWRENAANRIVPAGEWTQTMSAVELASGLIDGNPGVVGVSWQGGGHALEVAEVKTAARLHAEIEATASDEARRQRDSLLQPVACRDPQTGKQMLFDPAVIDYSSDSELLFAGPNSWEQLG